MAKDCNFNTMHPFVTKRVHFSGYLVIVSELKSRSTVLFVMQSFIHKIKEFLIVYEKYTVFHLIIGVKCSIIIFNDRR